MSNHIVCGASDVCGTYSGFQVGQVLDSINEVLNLDPEKPFEIYVNGEVASSDHVLEEDDLVECLRPAGKKGGDFWSKKEWLDTFCRNESDWHWCIAHGMPMEQHSNGWSSLTKTDAIKWEQKLKRHQSAERSNRNEHSIIVPKDTGLLNDMEQDVLEAIGKGIMTGKKVSDASGYSNTQGLRTCLASLVRRGLLDNRRGKINRKAGGYFRPNLFVDGQM